MNPETVYLIGFKMIRKLLSSVEGSSMRSKSTMFYLNHVQYIASPSVRLTWLNIILYTSFS